MFRLEKYVKNINIIYENIHDGCLMFLKTASCYCQIFCEKSGVVLKKLKHTFQDGFILDLLAGMTFFDRSHWVDKCYRAVVSDKRDNLLIGKCKNCHRNISCWFRMKFSGNQFPVVMDFRRCQFMDAVQNLAAGGWGRQIQIYPDVGLV